MRHTSFALIEVLPELDEKIKIAIDPKDLRIDAFMSGGHGGQSVYFTTLAPCAPVRLPTGPSDSCQNKTLPAAKQRDRFKSFKAKLYRTGTGKIGRRRKELRGEYKSAEVGQIKFALMFCTHTTWLKITAPIMKIAIGKECWRKFIATRGELFKVD